MRQTAERALADAVELEAVRPYFVGNAPAGHAPLGDAGTLFFHRRATHKSLGAAGEQGGPNRGARACVARLASPVLRPAVLAQPAAVRSACCVRAGASSHRALHTLRPCLPRLLPPPP